MNIPPQYINTATATHAWDLPSWPLYYDENLVLFDFMTASVFGLRVSLASFAIAEFCVTFSFVCGLRVLIWRSLLHSWSERRMVFLCQHSLWSVVFLCLSVFDDWDVLDFWPRVLCTIFKSDAVICSGYIIYLMTWKPPVPAGQHGDERDVRVGYAMFFGVLQPLGGILTGYSDARC